MWKEGLDAKEVVRMLEIVKEIPNFIHAVKATIRYAGLREKQVYLELNIDTGHWGRIMNGVSNFPMDKFIQFLEICGNDLALHWLAYQRGYEIKIIPKALEEQLVKERKEKEMLQGKLEHMYEVFEKMGLQIKGSHKAHTIQI